MRPILPFAAMTLAAACDMALQAQETAPAGPSPVLPAFDAAAFAEPVPNPWFPLVPGTTHRYRGTDPDGEVESGIVTVVGPGPTIMGVQTVEVLDEVRVDDELVERTHDFYANDAQGNTWYFGEDVTNFDYGDEGNLLRTDSEGAWRAGVNGAMPGISVPGNPSPDEPPTFQEYAPADEAMDWAQTRAVGLTLGGPAGTFAEVVQVFESSTVEPESRGYKYYAPGTGLIREEELGPSGDAIEMTIDLQP